MNNLGKKFKVIRAEHGLSQDEFCAVLGEKPSKIRDIEAGRQRVNDEFVRRLILHFPVDLNWLFDASGFGGGHYPRIEPPDLGKPLAGHFTADGEDYSLVRRLDLSVSAGNGLEAVEHGETERMAFSRTWLIQQGLAADLCALVRVQGDSMAPTIPDGGLVLLNAAEKRVDKPGIYAFTREGEAYVKRLLPAHASVDGRARSVVVMSDNPAFAPLVLGDDAMNSLRIAGRVRAVFATV